MDRKTFIISGLAIIQLCVTSTAILMYLSFSQISDVKAVGSILGNIGTLVAFIGFGIILHLRFKALGRRKRTLALCLPFFIASSFLGGYLALGYIMPDVFGAHDRFFGTLREWSAVEGPKPATAWNVMQKLDYILFNMPAFYLINWGLFALLWFGSLDPRAPSSNRLVQFMKTGFQRKAKLRARPLNALSNEVAV